MLGKYKIEMIFIMGFLLHATACSRAPLGISVDAAWHIVAISYLCYMYAFYALNRRSIAELKDEPLGQKKRRNAIIVFISTMYVSNAIDEFLLDPTVLSYNEYLGALIACLISYLEYKGYIMLIKVKLQQKHTALISKWRTWQYVLWRKK